MTRPAITMLTIALVAVLLTASLTACGRKGAPEMPPGSSYPSQYPNQ